VLGDIVGIKLVAVDWGEIEKWGSCQLLCSVGGFFLLGGLCFSAWLPVASTAVAVVGHIETGTFEDNGRG